MGRIHFMKFEEADFPKYYDLVSDIRVMRQITEYALAEEEAKEKFKKLLARNRSCAQLGSFQVLETSSQAFIGLAHLTIDEEHPSKAELGYMLLPQYWNQGYGTETMGLLMNRAAECHLTELTAMIDPDNVASRKLLIRHGFHSTYLGTMDGLSTEILSKQL